MANIILEAKNEIRFDKETERKLMKIGIYRSISGGNCYFYSLCEIMIVLKEDLTYNLSINVTGNDGPSFMEHTTKLLDIADKAFEIINGKPKCKVIAAEFEPEKMHLYDVKTKGKHPVHLVDGGSYLTEDDRQFEPSGDMGWFWLNQREYDYFKSKCKEVELELGK